MHIILDSNIYAADYRMMGVAFQSLFEYLRLTESRLVLPRVVREEVVIGYGRRLKQESNRFEDAWRRYRHVDLGDSAQYSPKPDCRKWMRNLRQRLMKPTDGVTPIYISEITGPFLQEAFMRGIHRTKPANNDGEELRDVILWLWALSYSDSANTDVVFISDDGEFWSGDEVHPDIDRDVRSKAGRFHLFRSIPEFLKSHAPAPSRIQEGWLQQHFKLEKVTGELTDRALTELQKALPRDEIRDLSIEFCSIKAGRLYEISSDAQFAELILHLKFKFMYTESPPAPIHQALITAFGSMWGKPMQLPTSSGTPGFGFQRTTESETAPKSREARLLVCGAEAELSIRIKNNEATEISVDKLIIDRQKLFIDKSAR